MKSDIEISRETVLKPIQVIAAELQIPADELIPYGKYAQTLYSLIGDRYSGCSNTHQAGAVCRFYPFRSSRFDNQRRYIPRAPIGQILED